MSETFLNVDLHPDKYQKGVQTFASLFTRLMDLNEFSHPTMVNLTKNCMSGSSWLHSSQISGLRHGKLYSPGPRTFVAIQALNYYLWRFSTEKQLLPNTLSSSLYSNGFHITEDNIAPSVGWWVEVFCGERTPKEIDLYGLVITENKAIEKSREWAKLIRVLMIDNGIDIISDLDAVLRDKYPARDEIRLTKIKSVLLSDAFWSPEEMKNEFPAITALSSALGGPTKEADFYK